jgi:hypothetical protein
MIGYDQFWYAKQLELGLLMPRPQKALKQPKTAVKTLIPDAEQPLDQEREPTAAKAAQKGRDC